MICDDNDLSALWESFVESLNADDVVLSGMILVALQSQKDQIDREAQERLN